MSLAEYAATEGQRKIAQLFDQGKTPLEIAKLLGIARGHASKTIHRLRKRQSKKDPGVHSHAAPSGYELSGVSTMRRDKDGNIQWVKTRKAAEAPYALLDAFVDAVEARQIAPTTPTAAPRDLDEDLLCVYPLGDPHIGLITSALTTPGEVDLDRGIAELLTAVDSLVLVAPHAKHALIVNLGDFFHADTMAGVTLRSGNKLSVDPRWQHVLQAGVETMIRLIDVALTKHEHVTVTNRIGNHDDHSAWMLSLCLHAYYRNEPRVTIVRDPSAFWNMEFGNNLIAATHGNGIRAEQLPGIMATDWPMAWGRTKYRRWYVGHVHHKDEKDYPGCEVIKCRTMARPDVHSHSSGYRSPQGLRVDVLHRELGHRTTHTVGLAPA